MSYTLYNKKLDRRLTHPEVGMWFTTDLQEAKEMLGACHEYLVASGLASLLKDFVIIDTESGDEIVEHSL